MQRFAPAADMFYAGTLCGLSSNVDGETLGCLHFLRSGKMTLTPAGSESIELTGPCVVLIPRPMPHQLEGLGGEGAKLMCATLSDLGPPLAMLLPELTVVDMTCTPRLLQPVNMMFDEAENQAYGHGAAIDRLLQYALILMVRHLIESDMLEGGILQGLADPKLGPALQALHNSPEHDWTLGSLAALSHLPRSAFAQRFTQVFGKPPLLYLTQWRMGLACCLLGEGKPVKVVAHETGYRSPDTFSRVFLRPVGSTPGAWQRQRLGWP